MSSITNTYCRNLDIIRVERLLDKILSNYGEAIFPTAPVAQTGGCSHVIKL